MQLVRNDARHDARVARAAAVMRDGGLDPVIVAVTSTYTRDRRSSVDSEFSGGPGAMARLAFMYAMANSACPVELGWIGTSGRKS